MTKAADQTKTKSNAEDSDLKKELREKNQTIQQLKDENSSLKEIIESHENEPTTSDFQKEGKKYPNTIRMFVETIMGMFSAAISHAPNATLSLISSSIKGRKNKVAYKVLIISKPCKALVQRSLQVSNI